jgi:hypothetical protein
MITGVIASLEMITKSDDEPHTRATSSTKSAYVTLSAPSPPCASGNPSRTNPESR